MNPPDDQLDHIRSSIDNLIDTDKIMQMVVDYARNYSGPAYDEGYEIGWSDGFKEGQWCS